MRSTASSHWSANIFPEGRAMNTLMPITCSIPAFKSGVCFVLFFFHFLTSQRSPAWGPSLQARLHSWPPAPHPTMLIFAFKFLLHLKSSCPFDDSKPPYPSHRQFSQENSPRHPYSPIVPSPGLYRAHAACVYKLMNSLFVHQARGQRCLKEKSEPLSIWLPLQTPPPELTWWLRQ